MPGRRRALGAYEYDPSRNLTARAADEAREIALVGHERWHSFLSSQQILPRGITVHPRAPIAFVAAGNYVVRAWNLATRRLLWTKVFVSDNEVFRDPWAASCAPALSPDGRFLACESRGGFDIVDLDAPLTSWHSPQVVRRIGIRRSRVSALAWNPSGRLLVAALEQMYSIEVYEAASGTLLHCVPQGHAPCSVGALVAHPREDWFVSGGDDGALRIWRWTGARFDIADTNAKHRQCVSALATTATHFASAAFDGCVSIWAWATGTLVCRLEVDFMPLFYANSLAWDPSGARLVVVQETGLVRVWNTESTNCHDWFCAAVLPRKAQNSEGVALLRSANDDAGPRQEDEEATAAANLEFGIVCVAPDLDRRTITVWRPIERPTTTTTTTTTTIAAEARSETTVARGFADGRV